MEHTEQAAAAASKKIIDAAFKGKPERAVFAMISVKEALEIASISEDNLENQGHMLDTGIESLGFIVYPAFDTCGYDENTRIFKKGSRLEILIEALEFPSTENNEILATAVKRLSNGNTLSGGNSNARTGA